ncbi:FAS1 domain-containing protein [Hyaloraphidium curvatum]|nr:FAS1 domain-containing protein [Hyaloraphidium curvatum]
MLSATSTSAMGSATPLPGDGTTDGTNGTVVGNCAQVIAGSGGNGTGHSTPSYSLSMISRLLSNDSSLLAVLNGSVSSVPNVTFFAPTDQAVETFASSVGAQNGTLPENIRALLPLVLAYHTAKVALDPADLANRSLIETLLTESNLSLVSPQVLLASKPEGGQPPLLLTYGLGNAGVVDTLNCTNGVVHVVNSVLYPPNPTAATLGFLESTSALAAAINGTDLAAALGNASNITVFAPSNDALAAAEADTLGPTEIERIVKYHVVESRVMSFEIPAGNTTLNTLLGEPLVVTNKLGNITVGGARVIRTDVLTEGGVVHVIDKVLMPPANGTNGTAPGTNGTTTATATTVFSSPTTFMESASSVLSTASAALATTASLLATETPAASAVSSAILGTAPAPAGTATVAAGRRWRWA